MEGTAMEGTAMGSILIYMLYMKDVQRKISNFRK